MASSSHLSKKPFGRCNVEWQIEHFSLQTFAEEWTIQSPEFTINGSEETSWCMDLRSELRNERRWILFSLRRSSTDLGPKYTWLNLHMYYTCSDARCGCFKKQLLSLKNGSKYEVCLGDYDCVLLDMNRFDDLFIIVCDMIVYSNNGTARGFGECNDAGIKLLSKNMLDLYRSAHNFDTKLLFNDNVILAHRAILSARNEYLYCELEEADTDVEVEDSQEYTIINFTDRLDYKGMSKILAYLYSGDMRHVIEEPSFEISSCACILDISEIANCYEADELILKSTIDFEEKVYNLRGYSFENSRFLWCVNTERSTKTCQLLFYPIREQKDYIPLFKRTFEKPMAIYLEVNFSNKKGLLCVIGFKSTFTDIDRIISETIKKLYSSHDSLDIVLKLKLTAGMNVSYIDEQHSVFVSYINEDFPYESLSTDLEFLLDGGPFADVVIDNNGIYFRTHKCILASRSLFFFNMLLAKERETIDVPSIAPHILSTILTYIYAGTFSDEIELDEDVIGVYKAAVWSNLSQLKSMCSDSLKMISKTDRNIRCLVVRLAEEYGDVLLKKYVLDNLFDRKNIILIPNLQLSLQDVHTCRHCRLVF